MGCSIKVTWLDEGMLRCAQHDENAGRSEASQTQVLMLRFI